MDNFFNLLKYLIIFLVNKETVKCLIDSLVVQVLYGAQIWFDHFQVVKLGEEIDSTSVIHARRQHQKQIVQHQRLVIQVKLDTPITRY